MSTTIATEPQATIPIHPITSGYNFRKHVDNLYEVVISQSVVSANKYDAYTIWCRCFMHQIAWICGEIILKSNGKAETRSVTVTSHVNLSQRRYMKATLMKPFVVQGFHENMFVLVCNLYPYITQSCAYIFYHIYRIVYGGHMHEIVPKCVYRAIVLNPLPSDWICAQPQHFGENISYDCVFGPLYTVLAMLSNVRNTCELDVLRQGPCSRPTSLTQKFGNTVSVKTFNWHTFFNYWLTLKFWFFLLLLNSYYQGFRVETKA